MQNNYYFLRQLTRQIETKISGLKLMECFSQEKDELVLGFAAARGKKKNYKEFYIKAVVFPDFSCLYFTDQFERARKNSIDLFSQLLDLEVAGVRQFLNERCFAIDFEQGFSLVFKMYGNRSNIILFSNGEVIDLFHSRIVADKNLDIQSLDRSIDQSHEAFMANNQDHRKLFPTFGKLVNAHLEQEPLTWERIQKVVYQLEYPSYYLIRWQHEIHLSLLPMGEVLQEFQEPMEAINAFYVQYNKVSTLDKEKADILRKLNKEKKQTELYLKDAYQRLETIDSAIKNEEIGHILMANLHQIPERAEKADLFDFYRNQDISIKLRADLTPQKNAENFYRKAKNEKIEIEKIMENIENREELLKSLNLHIEKIEEAEHLKALRTYLKTNKLSRNTTQAISYKDLFKRFEVEGFEILVGRNAKNNDLLTQQYAYKEDLWLHARDAQGSHVLVKYKSGKKIPNSVKEAAASLAAYYSKRRNETLAPVILTQKKFVRKTKDLAEGQVIVEKEEVVMVEPKLPDNS
ncbi:NFACT RNA binding domain-containing protein [Emticicia fluvialis]|uniref:NFACT RNA binding domain-containing protein n=1 Tax=Emticicia fluvialis TaxID=2974474 RepID=UPI0021663CF8|nr:NFACT RNA binding domain-containing protein [Emticicia fluvialis]